MAFDTVIDKAQLEAAMKATADAIREKTGDTANCTWDPSQGFAGLIAAIEIGGGRVARGTWVQASDDYYNTITHNLGKVPELAVIWETNGKSSAKHQCLIGVTLTSISFYMYSTGTGSSEPYGRYTSSKVGITGTAHSSISVFGGANTTTIEFGNLNNQIIAGSSYEYIIM